jgi:WD40 repeat protein/serine/threonine protein kinase/tetratricopeptide (TPR) repeat protein
MRMASSTSSDRPFERLAEEFAGRWRRGERPSLTEYCERYPEHADKIRELFPALVGVEQLKRAGPEATGPYTMAGADGRLQDRLGDFRILREVGRGGMGIVYEAEQESLGRHVALKVLPPQLMLDAQRLERFRREARAAARLHHSNIVPVFGVGEEAGQHYYVMQFIPGQSLSEVLAELKRRRQPDETLMTDDRPPSGPSATSLPSKANTPCSDASTQLPFMRRVARIGAQVADALAYAHAQGIIHRDIKPSNLLLDASGSVWVTDFGLAKVDDNENLTHTGDLVGTLRYLAPERFQGRGDHRSDLYALGLTLYELLTQRAAYEDSDRHHLIRAIQQDEPPRPRSLNRNIPKDLETIVLKAIDKDPARRYPTGTELAADLQRFLEDRPIRARPVSAGERFWRWCRKNPALASATGIAATLLLAVSGVSVWFAAFQARANRQLQDQRDTIKVALAAKTELTSKLETTLQESKEQSAQMAFQQAQTFVKQRQLGQALLWLTRALELAPEENTELQRVIRSNLADLRGELITLQSVIVLPDAPAPPPSRPFQTPLVISPDGKRVFVANGAYGKEAVLYENLEGKPTRMPLPPNVQSATFSPDGKTLLLGMHPTDGTSAEIQLELWDVETRKPLVPPLERLLLFFGAAFSPDGRTVLIAAGQAGRLYDAKTGRRVGAPLTNAGIAPGKAFSGNGKVVATSGADGTARLWDAATGQSLGPPIILGEHVESVALSPDGRTLVSAGKSARVWDVTTRKQIARPMSHAQPHEISLVVLSPDGKTLVTTATNSARVWDVATQEPIGAALPYQDHLMERGVVFGPDGRLLATADGSTVWIYDALTGEPVGQPLVHPATVGSVVFSRDGRRVLTASEDACVRIWRLPVGRLLEPGPPPQDRLAGPKYRHAPVENNAIQVYDARTGEPVGKPLVHPYPVGNSWYAPDGRHLVTTCSNQQPKVAEARVWDIEAGTMVGPLKHASNIRHVAFRGDGSMLATVADAIVWWDSATGQRLGQVEKQYASAVAFSGDGKSLLSLDARDTSRRDTTLRVWDLTTAQMLREFKQEGRGQGLIISPDQKVLTTFAEANKDNPTQKRLLFLNRQTLEPLGPPLEPPTGVRRLAFDPAGAKLLTAGDDRRVCLWDLETRAIVWQTPAHESNVDLIMFSPRGEAVLTVSGGRAVRAWNAATGKLIGQPIPHEEPVSVRFLADGRGFRTSSVRQTRQWDLATGYPLGLPLTQPVNLADTVEDRSGSYYSQPGAPPGARYELTPLPGDAGRLATWGQVLTGLELGRDGVLAVLDGPEWVKRHRLLEESGGSPVELTDLAGRRRMQWQLATQECERRERWLPLVWCLDRLLEDNPEKTEFRRRRARAHFALGNWAQAAADHAAAKPEKAADWFQRGWANVHLDKLDEARQAFEGLQKVSPDDAAGWLGLYLVHGCRGEDLEAEAALTRAAGLQRRTDRGELSHLSSWDQTVAQYGIALEQRKDNWQAWRGRATINLILQRFPQAVADYSEVLARKKDHLPSLLLRSAANLGLSEWSKVVDDCTRCIELRPDTLGAWQNRAIAYTRLRQWDKAAKDHTEIVRRQPGNLQALANRADCFGQLEHWDKAAADYALLIEKGVTGQQFYYLHALMRLKAGDAAAYRKACGEVLKRFDPTKEDKMNAANSIAWTCCLGPDATDDWERVMKLADTAVGGFLYLPRAEPYVANRIHQHYNTYGAAAYRSGRYELAVRALERAMFEHGQGGSPFDWLFLAMAHQRLGHDRAYKRWLEQATDWLDHSTRDKPKDARAGPSLSWNGWLELQLLRTEAENLVERDRQALAEVEKQLDKEPDDAGGLGRRARLYGRLQQTEKAAADYERLLAKREKDAALWLECGEFHASRLRWDKTAAAWARAAELRPEKKDLRHRVARAYAEAGQWEQALAWFHKDNDSADAARNPAQHYFLALAQLAAGQADSHRQTCDAMLKKLANSAGPDDAERVLTACVLTPSSVTDAKELLAAAEKAHARRQDVPCQRLLAYALLRAGKVNEAKEQLGQLLAGGDRGAGQDTTGLVTGSMDSWIANEQSFHRIVDTLFLALTLARQGDWLGASAQLARAREWLESAEWKPAPENITSASRFWSKRLIAEQLYQEAAREAGTSR